MRIAIVGTGYVGLVTGTCLADFGLSVTCVDNDEQKIHSLNNGKIPIYEPNLEDLIVKNVKENRLRFTTDLKKAVEESQVIFIAVGTPSNHDGSASLHHVEEVALDIARYMNGYKVIVNKCTVPVGTARKIKQIISGHCDPHFSSHCEGAQHPKQSQFPSKQSEEPPFSSHCEDPHLSSHCEEQSDEAISNNINPGDLSTYNPCKDTKQTNHCNESHSPGKVKDSFSPPHREDPDVIARSEATKQSQFPSSSLRATDGNEAISSSPLRRDSTHNPSPSNEDISHNPSPSNEDISHNPSPLRGEGRVRVKHPFDIISNPEFLREGSAVHDFTHPDKIVIGYESEKAKQIMQEIYRPLYLLDTPFVFTNLETAEMIKYACNAFLATKITFINEIANLCDRVGADVHQIAKAMGMDGRISPKFLHPGPGYGGSCFPKDTRAIHATAHNYNYDFKLIKAVIDANTRQREIVVDKIEKSLIVLKGKTIGILGLAFKQNTDDIRESAAIDIIHLLLGKEAKIRCFDPMAMDNTKKILPDLTYCQDEYETAKDTDALVILTEWNQFRNLDFNKIKILMKDNYLFDMKNLYEPSKIKELGFKYYGIGRN